MRQTNRQAVSCLVLPASVIVVLSMGCGSAGEPSRPSAPEAPDIADAGQADAAPLPVIADAAPPDDAADAAEPVDTGPPTPPPPRICTGVKKTHVVKVLADAYDPPVIAICVGDSVKWEWVDGLHSVTEGDWCQAFDGFDSGDREPPATWTHVFPGKGFFPYYSDAEPTFDACTKMEGYITVTDH